jgi:hypothetical protein
LIIGQDKTKQERQEKTKKEKRKEEQTRQDKTRRERTRQNKGSERQDDRRQPNQHQDQHQGFAPFRWMHHLSQRRTAAAKNFSQQNISTLRLYKNKNTTRQRGENVTTK